MTAPDIFAHLTPAQKEAVTTLDGPLLIIAGAGSGKTRVVTQRIAYLIQQNVDPHRILAITFTNKAAGEMKERISHFAQGQKVWVSTFHAFCAKILRRHAEVIGYSRHYLIYDTEDKKALIQAVLEEKKLGDYLKRYSLGKLAGEISNLKQTLLSPDETLSLPTPLDEIFPLYQERLKRADAMDFEDLLSKTILLFETDSSILKHYQDFFQYISVDEYQDTNPIQAEIIFLLGQKHNNVCVCGDPNQSIYSFRGARIENILKFSAQYPNTKIIKLEQNFRSTQNILAAASNVVSHNQQKAEHFQLFSQKETGSLLTLYICPSEKVEATLIAQKIQDFQSQGYDLKDIAVFYRVNAQSRNIENALVTKQIPYQIVGGTNFYQRKEVKDLLAYLRVAINPSDEISLLRILNVPPRGIGKTSIEHLSALATAEEKTLFWALQNASNTKIHKKALNAIEVFLRVLDEIKKCSARIYDTLSLLIQRTHYREYLASLEDHSSVSRTANIDELLQSAIEFEQTYPDQCGVEWFLEETALLSDIDQVKEEEDRVTLMTLHSSKGLEFPIVFLAGMEVGLLPHAWSLDHIDEFEEERRLCYVGFTRAQKELILSRCETRTTHGFSQMYPESPFLREIPASLVRVISLTQNSLFEEELDESKLFEEGNASELLGQNAFRSGDLVRHPNLGYGKILRLRGPKRDRIATIQFIDGSEKQIRMRFAQLEKADWSDIGEAP